MSQQQQMSMAAMGGPVGGPQMNAGTPSNSGGAITYADSLIRLNTAIYDYLLRNQAFDLAKSFRGQMEVQIRPDEKQSPSQRGQQVNGVEDAVDAEFRDTTIHNKPKDLPLPFVEPDFLKDWWCQFWEIWSGHRRRGGTTQNTQTYITAQRASAMNQRMGMMNANGAQNMRAYNGIMPGMNNGAGMPNDLKRAAMQNRQGMTPQQQQMMKNMQANQQNGQMMQGNQMERQGSQMDNMSIQRSGSPASGDAPSPKRQRIEGNMQAMNQGRPGQPGQIQGNQVGSPRSESPIPDPAAEKTRELLRSYNLDPDGLPAPLLHKLKSQPTNIQAQSADVYAQSLLKHQQAQMNIKTPNSDMDKGIPPNMGPGAAQGSPMSQPGMDGATGEFYAAAAANGGARMAMQPNAAGAAAAGQGAAQNGNHALQDYQMQLMLLEQQNKKRLLMARQEQDSMSGQHPGAVGPNGTFPAGMSPQGSQRGGAPSPNPNEMQRGMIDPSQMPPQMRAQMMAQGGMGRPPSSHPMMTQQAQAEMMRQQSMQMQNGQFPGVQPQQGMPGQPGQPGQPMGTPRQNNMPPPPAPQNSGGTNPSSPSQPPAPPTPSQASKAKTGAKKEAVKKGAAQKKGGANATPATESEAPPTPTPAPPITPINANSFNKNQNLPNGQVTPAQAANQQQGAQPTAQPTAQPNAPDLSGPFGAIDGSDNSFGMPLEFSNLDSGDVLDNFDFDSFLNQDTDLGFGFDTNMGFGDGIEAGGLDGTNG